MEEIMYPNNIEIGGDRSDEDKFWRILRIHRVLGYAQALADLDNNEDFYKKIVSIYDFKGIYMINWNEKPTKEEKEYLQKARDSIVTDYDTEPIEHEIINK